MTDYRNSNKGTAQSLKWRDTNEKGRFKLYAEVLCGSEARAKVKIVKTHTYTPVRHSYTH